MTLSTLYLGNLNIIVHLGHAGFFISTVSIPTIAPFGTHYWVADGPKVLQDVNTRAGIALCAICKTVNPKALRTHNI